MGGNSLMKAFKGVSKPLVFGVWLAGILLTAGCAGFWNKTPPPTGTESGQEAASPTVRAEETPASTGQVEQTSGETPAAEAKPGAAEPGGSVAKLEAPAKPAAPSAAAQAPEAGEAEEQAKPPLDLDSLENRLKNSSAIGFFTKLALKNQVDELLNNFRAFYRGHSSTTLETLRHSFELLFMKVLALLQDRDPKLAHDILISREAIWDVLSDPAKFAKI